MYNEELGLYVLSEEQYSQLASYGDGYEVQEDEFNVEYNGWLVEIWGDDILKALGLGPYSGGTIVINPSHQGGPM